MNKMKCIKFAVILVLIIVFVLINNKISFSNVSSFYMYEDSNNFAYQIENVKIEDDELVVKGWFFELKSIRNISCDINDNRKPVFLLYDINSDVEEYIDGSQKPLTGVPSKTEWYDRQDINEYFKCEYDYTYCGFTAKYSVDRIDFENGQYQIIIKFQEDNVNDWGIGTTTFIDRGEICYINPKNSKNLNVEGTDLEQIVHEGICVVNNPEYHIWVFQKDWKLYWIADEEYFFEEDGSTYIQYQLETTQFNKLPANRTDNGRYWSNLGDNFESNEISKKINCGKYRVYERDIPNEYSITRIETGYFADDKWIWQRYFRPILTVN